MHILIVEDEPLARDDLIGMLQPFADAHHITGCASAAEALSFADTTSPDLLITDIRMPGMDGLELVRQLKARFPHLEAIVLSGYSEFEYARTGLRLGITDYLLKPVRTSVLHQSVAAMLTTVAAQCLRERELREAKFLRLLHGSPEVLRTEPELLSGVWGMIFLIAGAGEGATGRGHAPVDRDSIGKALEALHCLEYDLVRFEGRAQVVLVPLDTQIQPRFLDTLAIRLHDALISAGNAIHLTYAIKHETDRPEQIVAEGLNRLERFMCFAASTFVRPNEKQQEPTHALHEHYQLIVRLLGEGRLSEAITTIYGLLSQLQRDDATQRNVIRTLDGVFMLLQQHAKALGAEPLPGRDAIGTAVRRSHSYDELTLWVDGHLQSLLMHQRGTATPRQLVRTLVALVHSAYANDISLQAFATEHNVSLAYFSRLFKDEVGMTFSEYLTKVRIEKAKELLARRDLRLSDISALVGYNDPKYFSQIFRKTTGIPPLDYQQNAQAAEHR